MSEFWVKQYSNDTEEWDNFVNKMSVNGTFLQTKRFLEYHPEDRFKDASIMIMKGNAIVAVIPACMELEDDKKTFYSHNGSTFGGIVLSQEANNIKNIKQIMEIFESYLIEQKYEKVVLRMTGDIFCRNTENLLLYYLFMYGYSCYDEISFAIDFSLYKDNVTDNFTASKRRDYKNAQKNGLVFTKLDTVEQIHSFYEILCKNLKKYNAKPVHTLTELLDLKSTRLNDCLDFYGVYHENDLIAGSMVFKFEKQVFHTQYLAADSDYLNMYPMNFLDTSLIKQAQMDGYRYFSFGISTENHGKVLNESLAEFKEGFGTGYYLNKTYYKDLSCK